MTAILAVLVVAAGANSRPQECQITLVVTRAEPTAPRSQREKIVAEPRIVTHVGRPGFFRIGGPVLSGDSGINGPGVFLAGEVPEIEVLPLELSDGRVRLEMRVARPGERDRRWVWEGNAGAAQRFRVETATGVLRVEVVATGPETVGRK